MSVVSRIIKKGTRMMSKQRVYLIVLDSFGIGHAPDAADFGDYTLSLHALFRSRKSVV